MLPDTAKIVQRMREILTLPTSWIQKTYSTDATGTTCDPTWALATCWCMEGAMYRALREAGKSINGPEYRQITRHFPSQNIPAWNDDPERTHKEVLAKLDRILEYA